MQATITDMDLAQIARRAVKPPTGQVPEDTISAGLDTLGLEPWSTPWRRAYQRTIRLWINMGGVEANVPSQTIGDADVWIRRIWDAIDCGITVQELGRRHDIGKSAIAEKTRNLGFRFTRGRDTRLGAAPCLGCGAPGPADALDRTHRCAECREARRRAA